jgi:ATP-dependent DNA ligase
LRVERDGDRVRLITRNGCDWTGSYPWIVETARRIAPRHMSTTSNLRRLASRRSLANLSIAKNRLLQRRQ